MALHGDEVEREVFWSMNILPLLLSSSQSVQWKLENDNKYMMHELVFHVVPEVGGLLVLGWSKNSTILHLALEVLQCHNSTTSTFDQCLLINLWRTWSKLGYVESLKRQKCPKGHACCRIYFRINISRLCVYQWALPKTFLTQMF